MQGSKGDRGARIFTKTPPDRPLFAAGEIIPVEKAVVSIPYFKLGMAEKWRHVANVNQAICSIDFGTYRGGIGL